MEIRETLKKDPVQQHLTAYYEILKKMQTDLAYLARAKELSKEQMLEKEIIRTIRTIMNR